MTRWCERFGESFRLTLVTDDAALAARADRAGVNRIGVDIERLGKAERQAGKDTRLSQHTWDDLSKIAASIAQADLFVRLNPPNSQTHVEIETALDLGARVLMLPFFRTDHEVNAFVQLVRGRAQATILLETAPAVVRIKEILAVPGVDEAMIGLNDLRLQLGVESHFEVMASPIVDLLAREVRRAGLPLALGAIARTDAVALPIPPDLVYAQYPRLNATGAWLSRSFFDSVPTAWDLAPAIHAVRERLTFWSQASPGTLRRARDRLAQQARRATAGPPVLTASDHTAQPW